MPTNKPMAPSQPPIDDSVPIPASVRRAAEAANQAHQAAYHTEPAPVDPPAPEPEPALAPNPDQPAPPPAPEAPPPAPAPEPHPDNWEHRYLSMKGRYDQAAVTIGQMQEQMQEIGNELIRTQAMVQQAPVHATPPHAPATVTRLTADDTQTYGPELVDFVRRAALDAVAPALDQTQQQVRQVTQRVTANAATALYGDLDADVPTWRSINVDPRFKIWCQQRDVYSGAVRGALLNAAFKAADAPRVVAFFKGFLAEEIATGQHPAPQAQPAPQPPREPAIPLEMLTAPGRAKPAGGEQPASADKPIYSRQQISTFYRNVNAGAYAGRQAEKDTLEQAIFAAQREGRVRG